MAGASLVGISFGGPRVFARGAFLIEADCPADTIFLLRRGQARIFRLDEDGREAVTAIVGPGHIVGLAPLLGNSRHEQFAQATTRIEAWALPAGRVLERLPSDRALLGLVAGALAQRFALAAGLFRDVNLLPVLERLADVERRLATCLRGEPPALTQAGLAQLIRARPETLARSHGRTPLTGHRPCEPAWPVRPGVQPFRSGELVLSGDLPSSQVGRVVSGQLEVSLVTDGGRTVQFDVLGPADLLGVSALVGMPYLGMRAVALSDGSLRVIDAASFLAEVADQPDQLRALALRLAARLQRLERRLGCCRGALDERLLLLIESLATEGEAQPGRAASHAVPGRWSHARLGQQIGVSRETVTRALAQLEARGAIHREGRRIVLHARPAQLAHRGLPSP